MTDLEISKALALVIGHEEQYTSLNWWPKHFMVCDKANAAWREFDYCDWNIIGPIAERYNCFPVRVCASWNSSLNGNWYNARAPQKAIALAVIGAKK